MVYSVTRDKLFCFTCLLFENYSISSLVSTGCSDWKHIGDVIQQHERSTKHFEACRKWLEAEVRLQANKGIDRLNHIEINKNAEHWRNVLE